MTIYLESHKILEINKILVKDYYTTHHNNALTIALHKNMSFPQPKDVNYILPKMNIPHLIINTKEAHPDHGIPPPTKAPSISRNPWHIFTHPLAPYLAPSPTQNYYGYGNNTSPQPQTLNYNLLNKAWTWKWSSCLKDTYKIYPPNPPIQKQNLNNLSQTP